MKVEPITLSGTTVVLEPLREAHLEDLYRVAISAPEVWRLSPVRMQTREDAVARFAPLVPWVGQGTGLAFVTRDAKTGEAIGGTCFAHLDAENRRVEIGYTWLLPAWQRTRANSEAKYLMLRHAFETWGMFRVELKTDARNNKSRNAILRIGAKEEGTLRSAVICWDGHRRDSVYFSVLDTEWPGVKERLEAFLAR